MGNCGVDFFKSQSRPGFASEKSDQGVFLVRNDQGTHFWHLKLHTGQLSWGKIANFEHVEFLMFLIEIAIFFFLPTPCKILACTFFHTFPDV